ncbi:MAG: bifunctional homocysteine S-methyltransferase/methylenetetrahydrofolate reductase [Kiritimatiellia bacterium]
MPSESIVARMARQPVVFDGAMGTEIYARGVFINRCFDEVCLTNPDLIRDIHKSYVTAGADVIETNTFGANRVWLRGHGLAEKTVAINRAGAALAREAAGDAKYVAGSIGPCLRSNQLMGKEHQGELADAFFESAQALAEGGVDFLVLETFSHIEELVLAAASVKQLGLPIMASFTVDARGETVHGRTVEDVLGELDGIDEIAILGMNCGTGPAPLFAIAERAVPLSRKPFVFMPNAGQPEEVDGRVLYLVTPEYFTSYAKRFIELGARGIGGCCGTTARHIREAARAVHALGGIKEFVPVKGLGTKSDQPAVAVIPMRQKCSFGAKLVRGEKVTSIEVLPPKSWDLSGMLERVSVCDAAGIDAVNIPDGPRASARISSMIAAIKIQEKLRIEPILHYCCRDRNLIGMQSDLLGGYAAGLRNFLIITGDPPKIGDYPDVTGVFDVDSIGLVRVANGLNHGLDIGGNRIDPPCGLLLGVGVDPCAVDLEHEIERYRRKIEAGAEYAITQPVFDADALLRFMDRLDALEQRIPVVAGVWPLVSLRNAEFMRNEVPGVTVPDVIIERMRGCQTREDGIRTGVDIAREMCARIADRVAGFQVSAPFGKVELAIDVLQ